MRNKATIVKFILVFLLSQNNRGWPIYRFLWEEIFASFAVSFSHDPQATSRLITYSDLAAPLYYQEMASKTSRAM